MNSPLNDIVKKYIAPPPTFEDGWETMFISADATKNKKEEPPKEPEPEPEPKEELDRSEPIVLLITNNSGVIASGIQLFNANSALSLTPPNYQNIGGISITSVLGTVSYGEILSNSQQKPFKIGETLLVSQSPGQTEQTFAITHKTDTGKLLTYTASPVQDPYQNLSDRVVTDYQYIMDGFTNITINSLGNGASVKIYLYIMKRFSPTRVVTGAKGTQGFSHPNVMRFARSNFLTNKMT